MKKNFLKGLIMAIVGFIASAISQDIEAVNVWYIVIATIGFTIIYLAKNAIITSISIFGKIDIQDIISGLLLAIGMAISSFAASIITTGSVNWHALWIAVGTAFVGYFSKTFTSNRGKALSKR